MTKLSQLTTHQVWSERMERFQLARQTVAEFCAAEGVSPASFYQWRRKLRPDDTPAKFVPVQLTTAPQPEPVTMLSVELPGGVRVKLEVTGTRQEQP